MAVKSQEPVDINTVVFDQSLPVPERIRSVIEQMNGDPHHFRTGDVEVTVRFEGKRSLEEVISHYLAMKDNYRSVEQDQEVA